MDHLLTTIALSSSIVSRPLAGQKPNQKLQEAALNFLAILIKGQPELTGCIKNWTSMTLREDPDAMDLEQPEGPEFINMLGSTLTDGTTSVRIAAANWYVQLFLAFLTISLANIVKADKGRPSDRVRSTVLNLQLLEVIVKLLGGEGAEERVRLCFILGKRAR